MTKPLEKPPRKDPQRRSRVAVAPPMARSRAALAFTARAARGELALQHCADCGTVAYPPRDVCPSCWSEHLVWEPISERGEFIAETELHTSTNVYFRERMPWRIGTIVLDSGVPVLAHIHGDVREGETVKMIARTDRAGQGVLMAIPLQETENMTDDKQFRELSCSPKHRRVLITDARGAFGQALAKAALAGGASKVFLGVAEPWKPFPGQDDLAALDNTELVPLDVTQSESVFELAGSIAHKIDILINTAGYTRPGAALSGAGIMSARNEMETNYFGLLRLLKHFGPVMRARAADGSNNAVCWVNLLSVYALSNWAEYGTTSASQAAALSLSQAARSEFSRAGIKVLNAFHGPLEDEWYQPVSPPKVMPAKVARSVMSALEQGLEEIAIGEIAEDVIKRWRDDPDVLEREMIAQAAEGGV